MAISFQYASLAFRLKHASTYKHWITAVIKNEKKRMGEINYRFATDEEVYRLNVEFLHHNTYTDIITFDSCENDIVNGDIIISFDRVKDNAQKLDLPFETELKRVIIHGVLHLCGYKDKTVPQKSLMRQKEDQALTLFPKTD